MGLPHIVSLGFSCQSTYQIRRIVGQSGSNPFDWLITPKAALFRIIETRFAALTDMVGLSRNKDGVVINQMAVRFHHDFGIPGPGLNIDETQVEIARARYARRARRLINLFETGVRIALIRQGCEPEGDSMSLDEGKALVALIESKYPNVNAGLFVFNPPGTGGNGRTADVVVGEYDEPHEYMWSGNDAWWDTAIRDVLAAPQISAPDRGSPEPVSAVWGNSGVPRHD